MFLMGIFGIFMVLNYLFFFGLICYGIYAKYLDEYQVDEYLGCGDIYASNIFCEKNREI